MFKRVLSLVIALIIVSAPLLSGAGRASAASLSYDGIESLVTEQYDAFAKALKPEGASEAVAQLLKHSIKGGGTLNLKATDKFSAGLLNSRMFRANFIHAATVAIEQMLNYNETSHFMRGALKWYEDSLTYSNYAYNDNENGVDSDDKLVSPNIKASGTYTGSTNTFDEGMILVVGYSQSKITFRQIAVNRDTITYKATIKVYDRFDFTGADYSGQDSGLADTLTWIGRFLSLGLLSRFDWSVNAELELTMPNPCAHQTNDYRWEFDGAEDLICVASGSNTANPLEKVQGTSENGIFSETYYALTTPIYLYPDQPWNVEWTSTGTGSVVLAEDTSIWRGGDYLRKTSTSMYFGEYIYLSETDEKKTHTQYGINFQKEASIKSKYRHTYLLKNCVTDDGSNMVYLYIDGEEIGPMNQYFIGSANQGATSDWINGKKLSLFYIGNASVPLTNVAVEYIQVREGGENPAPYNLCTTSTKQPTCAQQGKTTYTCSQCGVVFSESIPMLEHDPLTIPGTAPTCIESGLSEGSKCNSCGKILKEQAVLEPLGHSFEEGNCTLCGEAQYAPGDTNLDGNVDVDDVLALLWYVLFPEEYTIEVDADFDESGTTDVDDVLKLLWYVLFPEEYPLN